MSEELDDLRQNAFDKLDDAIKAWYDYFKECEVGEDRIFAHSVYGRLFRATIKWISVKERIPEDGVDVLVKTEYGCCVAFRDRYILYGVEHVRWSVGEAVGILGGGHSSVDVLREPTEWMPLPPKE